MAALVVYESIHGNTETIAKAVGKALGAGTRVLSAAVADASQLKGVDLLVVGSPTYGGRPTPQAQAFLGKLAAGSLQGVRVAAFDTRITMKFARIFGYAADKIMAALAGAGGKKAGTPQGFIVKGTNGPLADGEAEKAAAWAKGL
jgi:flavodoxin I